MAVAATGVRKAVGSAGQPDADGSQGRTSGHDRPDRANDLATELRAGQVPADGAAGGGRQRLRDGEPDVQLVWDPPWNPVVHASDEAKDALGIW